MVKWRYLLVSAALLMPATAQGEGGVWDDVIRVRALMEDVHTTGPNDIRVDRVLTVLPEVRAMGHAGEEALVALFLDGRLENLAWRFEAAILLVGLGSARGARMVRGLLDQIADVGLVKDTNDMFAASERLLGHEDAITVVSPFLGELLVGLQDVALFRKMLWANLVPGDGHAEVELTTRKPEVFIPIIVDAVAGEEFAGRRAPIGTRRRLALFLLRKLGEYDEETRGRAVQAIEALIGDAHPVVKAELAAALKEAGVDVAYELPQLDRRKKQAVHAFLRRKSSSPAMKEELRRMLAEGEEPVGVPEQGEQSRPEAEDIGPSASTEKGTPEAGREAEGPSSPVEGSASEDSPTVGERAPPSGASAAEGGAGAAATWLLVAGAAAIAAVGTAAWLAVRRRRRG